MYQQVDTDEVVYTEGGGDVSPVATLADEYGGRVQIALDDGCYVLYLQHEDGKYRLMTHIFREAFGVLIGLQEPSKEYEWELAGLRDQP